MPDGSREILAERVLTSITEIHEELLRHSEPYRTLLDAAHIYRSLTGKSPFENGILLSAEEDRRLSAIEKPKVLPTKPSVPKGPRAPTTGRKAETKDARVQAAIEKLLRERGEMHRKAIAEVLVADGVMGDVKDPVQSLARYMTGAKGRFHNMGGGFWTMPRTESDSPAARRDGSEAG